MSHTEKTEKTSSRRRAKSHPETDFNQLNVVDFNQLNVVVNSLSDSFLDIERAYQRSENHLTREASEIRDLNRDKYQPRIGSVRKAPPFQMCGTANQFECVSVRMYK